MMANQAETCWIEYFVVLYSSIKPKCIRQRAFSTVIENTLWVMIPYRRAGDLRGTCCAHLQRRRQHLSVRSTWNCLPHCVLSHNRTFHDPTLLHVATGTESIYTLLSSGIRSRVLYCLGKPTNVLGKVVTCLPSHTGSYIKHNAIKAHR